MMQKDDIDIISCIEKKATVSTADGVKFNIPDSDNDKTKNRRDIEAAIFAALLSSDESEISGIYLIFHATIIIYLAAQLIYHFYLLK